MKHQFMNTQGLITVRRGTDARARAVVAYVLVSMWKPQNMYQFVCASQDTCNREFGRVKKLWVTAAARVSLSYCFFVEKNVRFHLARARAAALVSFVLSL